MLGLLYKEHARAHSLHDTTHRTSSATWHVRVHSQSTPANVHATNENTRGTVVTAGPLHPYIHPSVHPVIRAAVRPLLASTATRSVESHLGLHDEPLDGLVQVVTVALQQPRVERVVREAHHVQRLQQRRQPTRRRAIARSDG